MKCYKNLLVPLAFKLIALLAKCLLNCLFLLFVGCLRIRVALLQPVVNTGAQRRSGTEARNPFLVKVLQSVRLHGIELGTRVALLHCNAATAQ